MSHLLRRRPLVALAAGRGRLAAAARAPLPAFCHPLPPLSFEHEGQVAGLAADLLRRMAELAGLDLSLALQPRLRAEKSFLETPGSLLFPLARLPEREGRFRWVGPILPRRVGIYSLSPRSDIRFRGLQQLDGLRVGATAGTATLEQLLAEGLKPGRELEVAPSYEASVRKLLAGRMDLLVIGDLNLYWQLHQLREPADRVREVAVLDASADYSFGLRVDADPAPAEALQRALDQLRRGGAVERFKQAYGLPAGS
jgi:polar amino acid transport system substrate-binding protein